ncbi:hypothetical protein TNCV_978801 [Trichonephila clavipes]|nr:hypothetical protein TNCV_978801 [Trichonephila clavipes]
MLRDIKQVQFPGEESYFFYEWSFWAILGEGYFQPLQQLIVPLTNHNSAIQTIQDFTAETVCKKNSDSVATPPCHVRPTNQDTHSQAGPPTSGHIHYLDMGWRNASRSVSQ